MMVDERKKRQAQIAARRAVPAPKACGRCGESGRRIHRHHPDYAKPLVVQFLCPRCHSLTHREMASYKPVPPRQRIAVCLSPKEKAELTKAAEARGLRLSAFIRTVALARVRGELKVAWNSTRRGELVVNDAVKAA
jgi:hypothetical protein